MRTRAKVGDRFGAIVARHKFTESGICVGFEWDVKCHSGKRIISAPGRASRPLLLWHEQFHNLIPTEGLNHIVDVVLNGGTQDTTWFIGLLAASPSPAAGWTATEIASNDFVNYDEANLQSWSGSAASSGASDNSGSPAVFTISTNGSSIGGGFLIGTNAKTTPAGTLLSAGAFTGGNKSADDGDTLTVTLTFTATSA